MLPILSLQSALIYPGSTVLRRGMGKNRCETTEKTKVIHVIYNQYEASILSRRTVYDSFTFKVIDINLFSTEQIFCRV